jgi:hypothetical protein
MKINENIENFKKFKKPVKKHPHQASMDAGRGIVSFDGG